MSENQNEPREYDAVRGGQNSIPVNAAVLGGIPGVKSRLASSIVEVRIAALSEALKYGEAGLNLIIKALHDESIPVKFAAYSLLKDRDDLKIKLPFHHRLPAFEFDVITVNNTGEQNSSNNKSFARYLSEDLGNEVILEMVYIPGGTFVMGSPLTEQGREDRESPQHQVTVPAFYAGKYLITQAQWQVLMKNNPSYYKGEKRPVATVTWNEAMEFCGKLSEKTGKNYRLLSEAEWEYACRAGTTTPFYFGDTITPNLVNYNSLSVHTGVTTDVGSFPPNLFGLYDMHGNVCEWCSDDWHENYDGAPADGSSWGTGMSDYRVYRGGLFCCGAVLCRSAQRLRSSVNCRNSEGRGIRVAIGTDPMENIPGIAGVKSRLASPIVKVRIAALSEALKYGEAGLNLIIQALHNESIQVKLDAYSLLKDRDDLKIKPKFPLDYLLTFEFDVITVNAKGKENSRKKSFAHYFPEDLGNGVILDMVYIPGGTFMMGSRAKEASMNNNESPKHQVTVPDFYAGKYPITQAQYQAVMGNNPSDFRGEKLPVEEVSWYLAVEFCQKLTEKTGKIYRLLSEAEWEYACRAGTTTPFYFGETITTDLVNYHENYPYAAAPEGSFRGKTTAVGSFPPNAFGLYDMHGEVWEWCSDTCHLNYHGAPTDGSSWETETNYDIRVQRGGSWNTNAVTCRAAFRNSYPADFSYWLGGFRVAVTLAVPSSLSSL